MKAMEQNPRFEWLETGAEAVVQMLSAIEAARDSVRMEMYIFRESATAENLREALVRAVHRNVHVRVMIDALGSMSLPDTFFDTLRAAGGDVRRFNPLRLNRLGFRDHRKMLVCDETVAFVGGFNVGHEYEGDGINCGWCDVGIRLEGRLAHALASAFDELFVHSEFRFRPFRQLRKTRRTRMIRLPEGRLLLSGPGSNNPVKRSLRVDLKNAKQVQIICAYFLPSWRLRRSLTRLARHGAKVQIILPAKTDVPLSLMAARSFYTRLLAAGVEVYEYQPQILHAKLMLIDDLVYVGSANLDARSLHINYELLLRLPNVDLAAKGREIFEAKLQYCKRIDWQSWKKSRTIWERIKARFAYWVLARVDVAVARYQWRWMPRSKATQDLKPAP
ncbi:MAG: Phospholipase D/Transphosphatidylase [Verrucomicrobiales bacterium]|nr:Phospholipase D/Transphosphatidylase [Verrucomicrobiales bacterium]